MIVGKISVIFGMIVVTNALPSSFVFKRGLYMTLCDFFFVFECQVPSRAFSGQSYYWFDKGRLDNMQQILYTKTQYDNIDYKSGSA